MGEFVDTPMSSEFVKQGKIPEGSPGIYDNASVPPQNGYPRTSSPNAVKEKFFEKSVGPVSGEPDQGFSDDIHK